LDQKSKEAIFYQLAASYNWLESKKEKMEMLRNIEEIILPKLGIEPMHRKSLIRRLRKAIVPPKVKPPRGRKPKYHDLDKHHLKQVWKLSGFPCGKRLKTIINEWLEYYDCASDIKKHLRSMSASQMDIYLKQAKIDLQF